ncbi:aminoglycoside phosphotransferase (plasmid) [Legionella adelaidensis]|uniref:Aminoglycoside phosphotransferase n=1 Tax=Legionella adelaidensis TaxID=45056 RepID=A0A0W0R0X5_9GAMM|nr:aminoglycoside phosphotransferase family protein [Legionella adelaidensis]KTC64722.1 aminoglycoside phosphotransferase [Legionella adelaidensis]VEH82857.1 aminoglycoside phosphotransferase [Legionella adelaidensis]
MNINEKLAQKLISEQFPQWENLAIRPVEKSGWDNRTFHLGDDMTMRLPSSKEYAPQIVKEFQWLPLLGQAITTCQITTPLALGMPSEVYPWHWTVNRWIEGETACAERIQDLNKFAKALGLFLNELQKIDSAGGPVAGLHNFFRGGDLAVYKEEVRQAIPGIKNKDEQKIAERLWYDALSSQWERTPVWVHGDIACGNILVCKGQLKAVIDFGQLAIGDPACDLTIAWNLFTGESRDIFRNTLALDKNTWIRALGWTFWKTLCWPVKGTHIKQILSEVYSDYRQLCGE